MKLEGIPTMHHRAPAIPASLWVATAGYWTRRLDRLAAYLKYCFTAPVTHEG